MKQFIYCVFDSVTNMYLAPFVAFNDSQASNIFKVVFRDNPDRDGLALYCLCGFDMESFNTPLSVFDSAKFVTRYTFEESDK